MISWTWFSWRIKTSQGSSWGITHKEKVDESSVDILKLIFTLPRLTKALDL
jgi:hypothetical protein